MGGAFVNVIGALVVLIIGLLLFSCNLYLTNCIGHDGTR